MRPGTGPTLALAARDLAATAATDPSALVDFLDDLRAGLAAQAGTSRPFGGAAAALAGLLGEADGGYRRAVDLQGGWDWRARRPAPEAADA